MLYYFALTWDTILTTAFGILKHTETMSSYHLEHNEVLNFPYSHI